LENAESIRQNIHRVGLNAEANFYPAREWDFGGNYRLAYYSDANLLNELYLYSEVFLTFPPRQLKLVADIDIEGFAHSTVFPTSNHDILFGVIHPYFSPKSFAFYEGRIEWTQWLSRDFFVHSNQCYYSLQYALGWDS